ncbi:MAG TPA: autotransporter outer membrane beta-barrel domain-containing protein, partial [Bradyrhizobium sp.]
LGFSDFGYNSQQDYAATQFGANWLAVDNGAGTLRLGLAGTLGRLWVQPSAVDGPSKSTYNTELLAGTVTWQARAGWYLDGIVNGGLFDGEVTTPARGETAGLNGTRIGASLEGGYPVALGHGFAIEPQVQFVYQHLDFTERTDIDAIDLDLGSPNQGIFRGGLRFIKRLVSQGGMLITPYLKADFLQGIGGGDTARLSNVAFNTGDYGTAFRLGGGITGTLTRDLSIYGDVAWQQNVGGDGGFRGWAMNGGLRYAFGAPPPPVIGPMIVAPTPAPPLARTYMVFFDWDRASLSETARQILAQAAANAGKMSLTRIVVDGYADTTGTFRYNQRLSLRRAKSVSAELVRDGVPQSEISMHGYGDTHLLVPTGPNVRNARNRRVEIIFR